MEKGDFCFVIENSNKQKLRVFFTSSIILFISIGLVISLFFTFKDFNEGGDIFITVKEKIMTQVKSTTPAGMFYSGFWSSLFFVPISGEFFYYYAIAKGSSIFISLLMINAGFLLAQFINYAFGKKLSTYFLYFMSKKKLYETRRFINKRGWLGVFLFNLLPLPAPLLTFALGITRYNIYRLFFFMILGSILKYAIIIVFFVLTH